MRRWRKRYREFPTLSNSAGAKWLVLILSLAKRWLIPKIQLLEAVEDAIAKDQISSPDCLNFFST
jgi:hypothetical protein